MKCKYCGDELVEYSPGMLMCQGCHRSVSLEDVE